MIMRKLVNLKWWMFVAVLLMGMNSCIDNDDGGSKFYLQYPYMLQNDNGTYTPQMRLLGYDIESAFLTIGTERFAFKNLSEFIWELPNQGIYSSSLDSVPFGYYYVVVNDKNGNTERTTVTFYASVKKIGSININKLEYNSETNKLHVSLKTPVQNANYYYLMMKMPVVNTAGIAVDETMWVPYSRLDLNETNDLTVTVPLSDLSEGTFHFAVAASYETTFRISESITVELKGKNNEKDPTTGGDKE